MKTTQPIWRFAANLGDRNPLERGRLLFIDSAGHYAPELAYFDETAEGSGKYELRRFSCDRCTMLANDPATVSDNHYHADKPAWFADRLAQCAETYGQTAAEFARDLCGSDPVARAVAFDNLAGYFGADNFDSYPVTMTANEIRRKYRAAFRRARA